MSAVDADGNELAGIRLPDVSVPVATHTGWNLRDPASGAPEQVLPMLGSSRFFPATLAQREASGDPRASVEERYAGREDYVDRARAAAKELVAERYALEEDLELMVANAADRYDLAAAAGEEGD